MQTVSLFCFKYMALLNRALEYYRSIFVTQTTTPGAHDPILKIKIYFPSTKVYHKNYTENITLTEQFEH